MAGISQGTSTVTCLVIAGVFLYQREPRSRWSVLQELGTVAPWWGAGHVAMGRTSVGGTVNKLGDVTIKAECFLLFASSSRGLVLLGRDAQKPPEFLGGWI